MWKRLCQDRKGRRRWCISCTDFFGICVGEGREGSAEGEGGKKTSCFCWILGTMTSALSSALSSSMFQQTLQDMVKLIRLHRRDEEAFMRSKVEQCTEEARNSDPAVKATALLKLTYVRVSCFRITRRILSRHFSIVRGPLSLPIFSLKSDDNWRSRIHFFLPRVLFHYSFKCSDIASRPVLSRFSK